MAKCENKLKRLSRQRQRQRWHTLSHSLNYCVWPFVVIALLLLLLLSPSVFWSRARLPYTHTSWRIRIDLWSLSQRAPLRRSEQNWGVHCSCFACLLSVRVCVCERETCGQIFPPFFFIHSCITCTSLLSYLFCYVYTAENNVQSRQEICKIFNFDGNFLFCHTFIRFICVLIVFFFLDFCTHTHSRTTDWR